jgi:Domain of unknown function (DUF4410)
MKTLTVFAVALIMIVVSGCVGTKMQVQQDYTYVASDSFSYEISDQAEVTEEGMAVFKERLDGKLEELGLSSDEANKTIEITFTNYRMRHGASRALVGIMAGSDNITSTVLIKDNATGEVVCEMEVVSKNSTATGSAKGLIQGHADKIVNYIKNGKS